jgi:hypothetical protein
VSTEYPHSQQTGEMFWQHVKIVLKGVTDDTRIEIKPKQFGATSGYYRFFLDNIKVADPAPAVDDVLWSEWWEGSEANQKASEYGASSAKTTVSFGNAAITYSEGGSTAIKSDGLVFYDKIANAENPDPKHVMNLLVAMNQGYLQASGIPCRGVKKATLVYRSNSKLEGNHQVTSSVCVVTIGEMTATDVLKFDHATKKTYTITCPIEIAEGISSIDLRITNISATANIRVDGFELKVTELW